MVQDVDPLTCDEGCLRPTSTDLTSKWVTETGVAVIQGRPLNSRKNALPEADFVNTAVPIAEPFVIRADVEGRRINARTTRVRHAGYGRVVDLDIDRIGNRVMPRNDEVPGGGRWRSQCIRDSCCRCRPGFILDRELKAR